MPIENHGNIPRDMTASGSTSQYVLGSTDAEQERLIRQAARLDPYTERLFRDAGMGPSQRILDIGSGVGDVAMLAARLVGPSGAVVGVERDMRSIARARARVSCSSGRSKRLVCQRRICGWKSPWEVIRSSQDGSTISCAVFAHRRSSTIFPAKHWAISRHSGKG